MSKEPLLSPAEDFPPHLDRHNLDRRDPFLVVCRCFNVLTAICALLCVAVNAVSAVYSFRSGEDVFSGILRCYAVVIALFVAIAETEWQRIFAFWKILEYWVARGMLQVFAAVMTKALSEQYSGSHWTIIVQEMPSYMLLVCGLVYTLMGILCIGHLKRARLRRVNWKDQATKDLEEVEKRRKELQRLLAPYP